MLKTDAPRDEHLRADAREAAVAAMRRWGFAQIDGVLPVPCLDELRRSFADRYLDSPECLGAAALRVGHRRFMSTVALAGPFNDERLYANPAILPVLKDLLGDRMVMHGFGVVCALPGADAQHVHRDHDLLFPEQPDLSRVLPAYAVTVAIPLVQLDPTNGTTAVWPGSHRSALAAAPTNDDLSDALTPYPSLGSAYLMDYRLAHCGTRNTSSEPRPLLYLLYSRPWFWDFINYTRQPRLEISERDLEAVAPEHRALFAQAIRSSH